MHTENTAIDTHNIISSEMAANIIEKSVSALLADPSLAKCLPPIMLRGAPGVGKSSIIRSVAEKLGIGFIDIRLAEMEPVDLRGLPVPNHEAKSVQWYVTADLPRDPNSKGIILFDELTSAPKDLQVAAYELILDRRLGNLYKIPDGWFICAAGNRTKDKAVATAMSSALANRMMHFEMDADAEEWGAWAVSRGLHPSVTGFIAYRPACLLKMDQNLEMGWPSPRSWERVSHVIKLFDDEETTRKAVYGLVGPAVGCEFMEFHKINKNFNSVLKMMTDPDEPVVIPDRADEKYAMASAVSYLLWNGKDAADEAKRIDGFFRICMKLPADFATMLVKNATAGSPKVPRVKAVIKISSHEKYKEYKEKYGAEAAKKRAI
jgi:hypothetical protein